MEKQTVFFSHSSKDKDALIAFKNRFCEITCGVIKVFMSSDGESIPFGSNWVHKIDEGLKSAKIMFIFVTPNSILSSWIYFEAGYAYSRDIKVIPVGLGVDVTLLKPPLNLLQGFNVNSAESLNNFIAVINREISTSFSESFSEKDFSSITASIYNNSEVIDVFSDIRFGINSRITDVEEVTDIEQLFTDLIIYLERSEIAYSKSHELGRDKLLTRGIMVEKFIRKNSSDDYLNIHISPYNLGMSLDIVKHWLAEYYNRSTSYLHLYPNKNITLLSDEMSISSIIHSRLDTFSIIQDKTNRYQFKSISFSITPNDVGHTILLISYAIDNLCTDEVYELIKLLIEIKLIKK